MRGFHLYAALAGSLIVAIVVAYAIYLNHLEASKVNMALELQKRSQYIPYIDIMKEESFATTSTVFRTVVERFLRATPIRVPRDVYESGEFEEWMRDHFFDEESVRNSFALYLMAELRSYASVVSRSMTFSVEGSADALANALAEGVEIIPRENAVYVIIDPSQMSTETLEALPSLRVCQGNYCKIVSIFPKERTEITIPLRLGLAFQKAREAYFYLDDHKDALVLSAGFCRSGCAGCGVFRFNGREMEPVYPEDMPCDQIRIRMEELTGEEGLYRATGIYGGGCPNLALYVESIGRYAPCSSPEGILASFINREINELWSGREGNVQFVTSFITKQPTKAFAYQRVVDVADLIQSATIPIPDSVWEFLGINIHSQAQILPVSQCKKAGVGYCAYPRRLYFIYTWTDEDNRYSVSGVPMEYRFIIDLGELDELNRYIEEEAVRVKNLLSLSDEAEAGSSCITRLQEYCTPEMLKSLLSSVCSFEGTTLEEMSQELQNETNECIAAASIFIGENGACWDITGACQRGISLAPPSEIEQCAEERLASCWSAISALVDDGTCNVGLSVKAACRSFQATVYATGVDALLDTVISRLINSGDLDRTQLIVGAFNALGDPYRFCIANNIISDYQNGNLTGDCYQEVNSLLAHDTSPCRNPVASCLLSSTVSIDTDASSEFCRAQNPEKLLSTFHVNIYDPTYMAVGCYAGS